MKKLSFFSMITLFGIMIFSSCGSEDLKLDKKVYAPGETIKVTFKASPKWEENAWIGIIPSDVAHGKEAENDSYDIAYQYIKGAESGTFEFTAPNDPGKYDIRMNDTDDGTKGVEVASVSFEVK
ncbi:MAG: hypothetical protein L3J74_08530 [Bacteroidales bacterium]|nr:hypothetical protein [Bacteroidales bacterium]